MAVDAWSTSPSINRDPFGGNDWLQAGTTPYIPPASTSSPVPSTTSGKSSPVASGPADSFLGGLTSGFGGISSGLSSLIGSPGASPSSMIPSLSASTSVASKSGDAQSPFDLSFQYGGAFQVGGSGSQTQSAQQQAGSANNIAMYVAIGVAALIALASIFNARSAK